MAVAVAIVIIVALAIGLVVVVTKKKKEVQENEAVYYEADDPEYYETRNKIVDSNGYYD